MERANAVIMANYPQNGGAAAIADTLLGAVSPGGRLPVTWHKHWNCSRRPDPDQPGRVSGRCEILPARLLGTDLTYRYGSSDNTLFPFGYGCQPLVLSIIRRPLIGVTIECHPRYGLAYTNFSYAALEAPATVAPCENITLSVTVANTGGMDAAETVQVYLKWQAPSKPTVDLQLVSFEKVLTLKGLFLGSE